MSPPAPDPTTARLRTGLAWAGAAGLAVLTLHLYLVTDWPWPDATLQRGLVVLAAAAALAWLLGAPRPGRGLIAYGVYAGALVAVALARGGPEASRELWRQAAFLAVVAAAAAPLPMGRGGLVALHVFCLSLVLLLLGGPRSAYDHLDRPGFYHALEQWSGYPELGMLRAAGAAGAIGLACAARAARVRGAALLLAAAFAAATVLMQSRSATVTIPLVALWLLGVAAVKWRSKAAAVVLALGCVALAGVAVRGGGVTALYERAAGTLARETGIRERGWTAARAMAAEHPIAGVGLGAYPREYYARGYGDDAAHAYNIVLHVLAEGGAIGLLGWLALWGRVLWVGLRRASRTPRGAAVFALHGMLVAFLVRSQSEHFLANLATSDRVLLVLALWIGLTEGLALDTERASADERSGDGPVIAST